MDHLTYAHFVCTAMAMDTTKFAYALLISILQNVQALKIISTFSALSPLWCAFATVPPSELGLQALYWDNDIEILFLQGTERPPVLLVDGYNVLHMYVQHMQESQPDSAMATAQVFEELRTGLESAMITYSQSRRIKVVIVYDAMNRLPDPVYVDIRTSTRLAHSAFNLLSICVQYPDVLQCSLCTVLCNIKYLCIKDSRTLPCVIDSRTPLEIQHSIQL
jgi:hypothetical protein